MSKNKVGKEREGKERKNLGWQLHTCLWENVVERSLSNVAHARVHIGYVMILANFSVDISRGVNSLRG